MALSKGVGRPLKDYIQNNILSVVGCMLRVGQFPTKSFGLCNKAVKLKFNVKGSFSTSSSSSSNSNNKTQDSSEENKTAPQSESKNSTKTTRYKPLNSTGSLDSSNQLKDSSNSPQIIKINNDSDSINSSKLATSDLQNNQRRTVIIRRINRNNRIGGSFFISENERKIQNPTPLTNQVKSLPVSLIQNKIIESSFAISKPKNKDLKNTTLNNEIKFSFFGIIKWGIILAILAVFGFFTISQLNSIRKGWTN